MIKKYLITVSLLHLIFCLQAFGQGNSWDSTYRPGAYALKVGQFKTYANSSNDIVFLGNSITAGVDWHELLGMPQARNRGISGDISFGVVERISEVTEGRPAKVFILIGINDISRNIPDSLIVNNYRRIIKAIKTQSPTTRIYFQTLLPVNNEFTQFKNHYNKDERILWINDQIRALGKQEQITVIDLHPHFLNGENKLDKKYTHDGLHLNSEGYKHWAFILKNGNYLK